MRTPITNSLLILFFLLFAKAEAKIIHVPADSSSIQAGIDGAVDGDTVLVAIGHYYERIDFLGKGILVASNYVFDNDTTTIDSTIIDGQDNGRVVIFSSGEDSSSIIEGFTITNGHASEGGGVACFECSPIIINNKIARNFAENEGGGIFCCYEASPVIMNNTISDNLAGLSGNGISCRLYSSPSVTNNIISSNCTTLVGGGISCIDMSSPTISYNIITGNSVVLYGGGIVCMTSSSPTISNNTITFNSAGDRGSGIYWMEWCSSIIANNIISNNLDGEGMAGWRPYEPHPVVLYNDFWNNADGHFYNCPAGVGDTTWGSNFNQTPCDSFFNIIRDPLFADTIDFDLLCTSPCIDAGDPSTYVPVDSGGCRIDMGSREYPYILGDANSDGTVAPRGAGMGTVNIGDIAYMINYLFANGPPSCPYHAADTNCDGLVDIGDVVCLINYLFLGEPLPCGF